MLRFLIPLLVLSCFVSSHAHAFLIPVRTVEGRTFPTARADVEIGSARIYVERAERASGVRYLVDAEFALRTSSLAVQRVPLLLADEEAWKGRTQIWVDGRSVVGRDGRVGYDPALPDVSPDRGTFFEADVVAGQMSVVRVAFHIDAVADTMGRTGLRLPTQWLALWGTMIPAAHVELALDARPLAFQTTLSGATRYDEPENRVTWFLREWRPRIAFEAWWMSPWTALLLMANIEQCPEPMHVVRLLSQGYLERLRNHNAAFDAEALQFCASLPLILHGNPFPSAEVRAELGQIRWSRYLPGSPEDARVYEPNPEFSEAMLLEVETLYRNALRLPAEAPMADLPDTSDPSLRLIP